MNASFEGASAPTLPERLLRIHDVSARLGVSRSTIYSMIRAGTFPPAKLIGRRTAVWRESEINDWIERNVPRTEG